MDKIWRADADKKKLFHDECFEAGESRTGYTLLTAAEAAELPDDTDCAACEIEFDLDPELDEVSDSELDEEIDDDEDPESEK